MFYELFYLLDTKYVAYIRLYGDIFLLSRIGEFSKFYWYLVKCFPTCTIEYETELFPCIIINFYKASVRIFHTGKINLLGVKQVSKIVEFLSDAHFDYTLSCN